VGGKNGYTGGGATAEGSVSGGVGDKQNDQDQA
jgi:hypothetical protein